MRTFWIILNLIFAVLLALSLFGHSIDLLELEHPVRSFLIMCGNIFVAALLWRDK